jgi:hypothetical protein
MNRANRGLAPVSRKFEPFAGNVNRDWRLEGALFSHGWSADRPARDPKSGLRSLEFKNGRSAGPTFLGGFDVEEDFCGPECRDPGHWRRGAADGYGQGGGGYVGSGCGVRAEESVQSVRGRESLRRRQPVQSLCGEKGEPVQSVRGRQPMRGEESVQSVQPLCSEDQLACARLISVC